jgi:hypothetical protein
VLELASFALFFLALFRGCVIYGVSMAPRCSRRIDAGGCVMRPELVPVVYVFHWGLISDRALTRAEKVALIEAYCCAVQAALAERGICTEVRWSESKAASQSLFLTPRVREALDEVERDDRALRVAAGMVYGGEG